MDWRYLIALGSNQRHHRHGAPRQVLRAAIAALGGHRITVEAASPIVASTPLGPSRRRYANAAVLLRSSFDPDALLDRLKAIEHSFGRRTGGQPWRARVLDLDIVLWEFGCWSSPGLTIPHTAFRTRGFVVLPGVALAAHWRDPVTGLTLRQIAARLTRPRPLPKRGAW